MDAGGGFASITHGMDDETGAANGVTAGENARHTGHLVFVGNECAPVVDSNAGEIAFGRKRHWIESVRDQDDIGWNEEFGTFHGARLAPAAGVGFAEFHAHATDSLDVALLTFDCDGLGKELKL